MTSPRAITKFDPCSMEFFDSLPKTDKVLEIRYLTADRQEPFAWDIVNVSKAFGFPLKDWPESRSTKFHPVLYTSHLGGPFGYQMTGAVQPKHLDLTKFKGKMPKLVIEAGNKRIGAQSTYRLNPIASLPVVMKDWQLVPKPVMDYHFVIGVATGHDDSLVGSLSGSYLENLLTDHARNFDLVFPRNVLGIGCTPLAGLTTYSADRFVDELLARPLDGGAPLPIGANSSYLYSSESSVFTLVNFYTGIDNWSCWSFQARSSWDKEEYYLFHLWGANSNSEGGATEFFNPRHMTVTPMEASGLPWLCRSLEQSCVVDGVFMSTIGAIKPATGIPRSLASHLEGHLSAWESFKRSEVVPDTWTVFEDPLIGSMRRIRKHLEGPYLEQFTTQRALLTEARVQQPATPLPRISVSPAAPLETSKFCESDISEAVTWAHSPAYDEDPRYDIKGHFSKVAKEVDASETDSPVKPPLTIRYLQPTWGSKLKVPLPRRLVEFEDSHNQGLAKLEEKRVVKLRKEAVKLTTALKRVVEKKELERKAALASLASALSDAASVQAS